MKNKFNTLRKYILDNSIKEYNKETINGLFRSILEPLISNQKVESCILLRLNNPEGKDSLIRRLSFVPAKIYSYNDKLASFNLQNSESENIWDTTEFLVVLSQRYSAALIWDYSLSERKDISDVCLLYNSKIVTDISKKILENSKVDIKDLIHKYLPDRRENILLNHSINSMAALLNDRNDEILISEQEKKHMVLSDDVLETAKNVSEKAKFIAHEIKNNLSIINLYSTIAKKRLDSVVADEDIMNSINNALKNISNASENVSDLINDLRCLSAPYLSEVNIRQLILNTVSMCEGKANRSGVKINVENFDDFILTTDKTKFQCALTNLIYNAIEACSESCVINIDFKKSANNAKVFVKNNGEMIPSDIQSKIFEPDFTTKEKGNGLGLAICKKQLELTGGSINLVSSDEVETLFEIILPLS